MGLLDTVRPILGYVSEEMETFSRRISHRDSPKVVWGVSPTTGNSRDTGIHGDRLRCNRDFGINDGRDFGTHSPTPNLDYVQFGGNRGYRLGVQGCGGSLGFPVVLV